MKERHELNRKLDLMGDEEVAGWIEGVLRHTNAADIKLMHEKLTEALEDDFYCRLFKRVTKMCDKCDITFPDQIIICDKCGNDKLRSFTLHDNLQEILAKKK